MGTQVIAEFTDECGSHEVLSDLSVYTANPDDTYYGGIVSIVGVLEWVSKNRPDLLESLGWHR